MNSKFLFKEQIYKIGFVLFLLLTNNPATLWIKKEKPIQGVAQHAECLIDIGSSESLLSLFSAFSFCK